MKFKILFLSLVIIGCNQNENQPPAEFILSKKITGNFQSPESVSYDEKRELIYVSNGVGYAKNGEGFISKLSKDGEILDLHWIKNLNRPTGMAIWENQLFTADIDELKVFDLDSGIQIDQYPVLEKNPMLNDVAISETGKIYVTSSGLHGVYHLDGDSLKMFVQQDSLLKYANGIVVQKDKLIVAGWEIAEISFTNHSIKKLDLNPPINDFDGLAIDKNNNLLCTQVSETGKLWRIQSDGSAEVIFSDKDYLADFSLTTIGGKESLILPSGNHEAKKYALLFVSIGS